MSNERDRVLAMLEQGTISAEEANNLLGALGDEMESDAAVAAAAEESFGRPWEVPFFGGLVVGALGLAGVARLKMGTRRPKLPARVGAWATVAVGAAAIAVGIWSRNTPWLHLRVTDAKGDRISLSFPLPLFMASWLLEFAQGQVDDETAGHLAGASAFLTEMKKGGKHEPFTVNVDDGDGNHVMVYIG